MTFTLFVGDVRRHLRRLQPTSFDLAIVDPPYGQTSLRWDRRVPGWPALVLPLIKPTGSMWVFGSMRMFLECASEFEGWRLSQDIVWEKHNGTGLFNDRFRRVHEHALHFYRADARWGDVYKAPQFTLDATARTIRKKPRPAHWTGATRQTMYCSIDGGPRLMRSVMHVRSEHGRAEHPTQKPLALLEPLFLYACPPGGRVLEPFAGSAPVSMLAQRYGCDAVAIEASRRYAKVAQARIDQAASTAPPALDTPPSPLDVAP